LRRMDGWNRVNLDMYDGRKYDTCNNMCKI
jgi:hypothetical protein